MPASASGGQLGETKALNASALYYYQTQALEKLVADWTDEYEIETHPELLVD